MPSPNQLHFSDIGDLCHNHNLAYSVQEAGETGISEIGRRIVPTGMYAAIAQAGYQLWRYPEESLLASRILDKELDVLRIREDDIAARSFIRILNDSLTREADEDSGAAFTCRSPEYRVGTCADTEGRFGLVLNRADETSPADSQYPFQVVTDIEEQPVLLRKGEHFQTALSFVPITINGVSYPEGSLFMLTYHNPEGLEDLYSITSRSSKVFTSQINTISFIRLTAYALPPSQRQTVFGDALSGSTYYGEIPWNTPLTRLQQRAGDLAQKLQKL